MTALGLLRQRNYSLLWFAGLISEVGDWILIAALPFYVYARTGSTIGAGTILVAYLLPSLLVGSVAGVFVDRWERRRTMVAADLLRACVLLVLLFARGSSTVWLVYIVAFVESTVTQFFAPAKGAFIPSIVDESQLAAANALNSIADNLPRLVGPAIGGTILTILGLSSVALADAVSYIGSAGLIGLISLPLIDRSAGQQEQGSDAGAVWRGVWTDWLAGLQLVRARRVLTALFVVGGVALLADSMLSALLVAFLKDVLHGNASTFGTLMACRGVGGIVGGVLIAWIASRLAPVTLLAVALGSLGIGMVVMLSFPTIPVAMVVGAVFGIPSVAWLTSEQTLLQTEAPDRYRGRVLGAYGTTMGVIMLLGMLGGAAVAEHTGTVPVLRFAGLLWMSAGVLSALWLGRSTRHVVPANASPISDA